MHPIWAHFGDMEEPLPPESIDELLSAAKQLQKDDPVSACQILLICAVHQNYDGQREEALKSMGQILALAEQYALADELLWATWGAAAICVQAGDTEQAAVHLGNLQTRLRGQDEWVLANFVETVEQALCQQVPVAEGGESASSRDGQISSLMRLTFDWLGRWGFSVRSGLPEFQAIPSHNDHYDQLRPLSSDRHRQRFWVRLKQIVRGELKLRWVANGAHHRTRPELQRLQTQSQLIIPDRSEAASAPAPRTHATHRPQPEPASVSRAEESAPEASLLVYCLGPFRVYKNDQVVEKWPGNKCKQILKYLVVHRDVPVNQEILMEQFWPGMGLKAARRNLYQAVYSLRQALHDDASDAAYVLTEDNHYRLNPDLEIWVDSEAFNAHYRSAQDLLTAGHQEQAMQEFEMAEDLYQGEFLAEDRYEDWPLVHRENLKNAYLDTLSQLSQHFYTNGQYARSIYYSRKILAEDQCREDIHRLVMLCYLNLDQPHLALRQYHTCVEALKEELDVPPMPATEELYQQIRQKRHK